MRLQSARTDAIDPFRTFSIAEYGANYLIDRPAAGDYVDVEATPARWIAEVAATKTPMSIDVQPSPK
jgi:hypothetical protein